VPAVQNAEDVHQEAVSTSALVAVDVQDNDVVLDGDSGGTPRGIERAQQARGARTEKAVPKRRVRLQGLQVVRENDGASTTRIHDVLDADGDARADDLLHGEGMDDLGAVESQLSSLRGRNAGEKSCSRDLARVSGEDTIYLLPYLQLPGLDTNCDQSSTEIGVSTSNGVQQTTGYVAKESSDDRDLVTACLDLSSQCSSQICVELLVEALLGGVKGDDIGEVDELGRRATVVKQRSHVTTAKLLALGNDLVLNAVGDFLQVLRRLQDLRQALAFGIDLLGECSQDIGTLDGVLRGLDVVGADSFDDLVVAAVALLLGGAGGAEEAVGGAFGLVLGAACRTDNSGAVGLVTSPSRDVRSEVGGLVGNLTMPAIFSANFPTLVPPNLRTTQPPGRCFSSVWFAIRSTSLLCPLVMPDMLVACVFSAIPESEIDMLCIE
jgi:hypothetical protein